MQGLFADSNFTFAGTIAEQEPALLAKLNAYWALVLRTPRIVGMNVWHWDNTPSLALHSAPYGTRLRTLPGKPATEYSYGTEALPAVVARLDEIRAQLAGPVNCCCC